MPNSVNQDLMETMLKGYQNKNKKHVLVTASQDFLLTYWNKLRTIFCFCGWEVHPEPTQTSNMEVFTKIVNGFRQLTIFTKRSGFRICLGIGQYFDITILGNSCYWHYYLHDLNYLAGNSRISIFQNLSWQRSLQLSFH